MPRPKSIGDAVFVREPFVVAEKAVVAVKLM